MKIKTIDIQAKEWFDKVNGNSYFSAVMELNFGQPDSKIIGIPFQYGYGDYYLTTALHQLKTENYIQEDAQTLWRYCQKNDIILRCNKQEKCLKSEVKNFIKYL